VRLSGDRTTDLSGTTTLSKYAVVDCEGEYMPFDFLRLTVGINEFNRFKIMRRGEDIKNFPFDDAGRCTKIKW